MSDSRAERRYNPLTQEWVLVCHDRNSRPWTGQVEAVGADTNGVEYDATCALCPGNARAKGAKNPRYSGIHVFDNDFPALSSNDGGAAPSESGKGELFKTRHETGRCRVVCFSESHSLTLAQMPAHGIKKVIECFIDQTDDLLRQPGVNHVQIFENRGEAMGCSNPHPHAQIWAQSQLPTLPARESKAMSDYWAAKGITMLADYFLEESARGERIICENEGFVVMVPYWAAWPFETLIIPKRPISILTDFSANDVEAFADVMRQITIRYDNLFQTSFPYSAGIHQRAASDEVPSSFHLHMHFYPPLLRSASIRKFMVGYEMLAEAQRDLSPEKAAGILRNQSETHYLHRIKTLDSSPESSAETASCRRPSAED